MSFLGTAVTCWYRLAMALFDQPTKSITARSGTPSSSHSSSGSTACRRISALRTVEDEQIAAEVRAVSCSSPVSEGVDFLRSCLARKMKVGIVSNNSADAVHVFLDAHGLSGDVTPVVGRALRHPELTKPNPWPGCRGGACRVDALCGVRQPVGEPRAVRGRRGGRGHRQHVGALALLLPSRSEVVRGCSLDLLPSLVGSLPLPRVTSQRLPSIVVGDSRQLPGAVMLFA